MSRTRHRRLGIVATITLVVASFLASPAIAYWACTSDCSGGWFVESCTWYDPVTHEPVITISYYEYVGTC